jgi:hypothetical protein
MWSGRRPQGLPEDLGIPRLSGFGISLEKASGDLV